MTKEACIKLGKEYEDSIRDARPARHSLARTGQIVLIKNDLDAKSAWDNAAWISTYYYLMAEDYKKVRWIWELLRDGDAGIGRAEEKHARTAKALLDNFQNPEEFRQVRELILTNVRKIFFEVRAEYPKNLILFDLAIKKGTKKIKELIREQKTGLDRKKTELVIDYATIIPGLMLAAIGTLEKE